MKYNINFSIIQISDFIKIIHILNYILTTTFIAQPLKITLVNIVFYIDEGGLFVSNSKKLINFFVSFVILFLFLAISGSYIQPLYDHFSSDTINDILIPLHYSIALFLFAIISNFIRNAFNRKLLKNDSLMLECKALKFNTIHKIWFYVLILVIYAFPFINGKNFNELSIKRVIALALTLIAYKIVLDISSNSIQVTFLSKGIIIHGFDLRLEAPIKNGTLLCNNSGYYSYNDIENYFIYPDYITMFLINQDGKITFKADTELKRRFTGLMIQKKIKTKKFEN